MKIEWKQEYELGIDLIDHQHKHFIELVNMLEDTIDKNQVESKLLFLISYLVGYTETHLSTEEKLFDEYHYDKTAEHKESHDRFREKGL